MTRTDNVEYHAGVEAEMNGKTLGSNPYTAGGERAARWALGWEASRAEETKAYRQAVAWVRDEVETSTCIADDEATATADGFVSGFLLGLRKGSQGSRVARDATAEAFWRGNYRAALEWDRKHYMGVNDDA